MSATAVPVPSRLPSLTGLRFVAAATVVAQHSSMIWSADGDESATWLRLSFAGVSFFFLLSGFLLAWAWEPGQAAATFWRRRAARVYPTHLVTLLAGLLLVEATGRRAATGGWLPQVFLVQTWSPHFDLMDPGVNGVSWSLCCEAAFYLSFPLFGRWIAAVPARLLWPCAAATAGTIMALPALVTALRPLLGSGPTFGYFPVSLGQMWLSYAFPPSRLPEFLLGVLLARLVREGRARGVRLWHGALAFTLVYPLDERAPLLFGIAAATVVPLCLLLLGGAAADLRGARTALGHPVARRLGELSFALYMSHYLVIVYGCHLLDPAHAGGPLGRTLVTLLLLAVSAAAAWLLHTAVEKPWMRRLGGPRRWPAARPSETSG
ncbi:acyltransferase family protein [Actinacidiphila yeochonensis]|uniref:acyltransferase family protein n=1 Tax=Actinacidiphila yeochonensis TaxID=89050 RepID=UPI000565B0E9|nr:acyltransferase [Actinacidiphila yeochonensis]